MYSNHTMYRELLAANPCYVAGAPQRPVRFGGAGEYRSFLITAGTMPRSLSLMAIL